MPADIYYADEREDQFPTANLKKVDFVLQTAGKKKDLSSILYTVYSTVCTVDHSANSSEKKNHIVTFSQSTHNHLPTQGACVCEAI